MVDLENMHVRDLIVYYLKTEKKLKYYEVKFVVQDTAPNGVRKVLIFIIVILSL